MCTQNNPSAQAEQEAEAIASFAAVILETLGFGVVIIEEQTHRIVYVNDKIQRMSGFQKEAIEGKVCHRLLCPTEAGKCPISDLHNAIDNSEKIMLCADGSVLPIIKTAVSLPIQGKTYLVESVIDNSERKQMQTQILQANALMREEIVRRTKIQEQIEYLAYHDSLTALPNRLMLMLRLGEAIAAAKSAQTMPAILFLNLDGFKMANDTLGHMMGDRLLVKVSRRLQHVLDEKHMIARIGGDEFAILLENTVSAAQIQESTVQILLGLEQPFLINHQDFFITASIGIAVYPADGLDAEALVKNAGIAMTAAKERGKNQAVFCDAAMKDSIVEAAKLNSLLYSAQKQQELELYYQPQVDGITHKIIGMEALLRWNSKELGWISPVRFIPLAEQSGLIHAIGQWVIRTACQQSKRWQDAGLSDFPVSVNFSVCQFQDSRLIEKMQKIFKELQFDPQFLEVEITESMAMYETYHMLQTLNRMKAMGMQISIDDFGTEYASLKYLKKLPVDRIKIDKQFIQGIHINEKDTAITKTIINLARGMGLGVIAEGVETETQSRFLCENECSEIQGFYYYRPMCANDLEQLLLQYASPESAE